MPSATDHATKTWWKPVIFILIAVAFSAYVVFTVRTYEPTPPRPECANVETAPANCYAEEL